MTKKAKLQYDPFKNRHKFQDDVWGQITLNDLERDVIDTPEFQRLFRTSQMGFVELVYHTANHTRGAHSIGACKMATRLINRVTENTVELDYDHTTTSPGLYADFQISPAERVLIRLGALLHDVSHLPLSHDLERKSHKVFYTPDSQATLNVKSWHGHYSKHDAYAENPLLFQLICSEELSVLSRVLRYYSATFWKQLQQDATRPKHHHLEAFVSIIKALQANDWNAEQELLPSLLFHLLIFEKPEEAERPECKLVTSFAGNGILEEWHLGPKSLSEAQRTAWHLAWYQPFRHDIIGNTLSADLIDYLTRDPQRLGSQRRIDTHMLSHYALVNPSPNTSPKRYRCAIDLHDYKRGTTRIFLINDLFRLLDFRQDIHEKAVMHRVVQCANAMLARGILLMGKEDLPGRDRRPSLPQAAGLAQGQQHALQSEDVLMKLFLDICSDTKGAPAEEIRRLGDAKRLFEKITERRLFRPLVIIPCDWAKENLPFHAPPQIKNTPKEADFRLRTLAALVDSAFYSPFLFFVCSCVEKYLQGIFDTDEALCSYATLLADRPDNDALLKQAATLRPSRIITWAAPYKQLYKDPAIVIALDGFVDQIDHVTPQSAIRDESARRRIEAAIQDSDSKYETLWQLYVFISDGLYYSGILAKLLSRLSPNVSGTTRDDHLRRLDKSKAFLSLAFKAICDNWIGQDQRNEDMTAKEKLLEQRMDVTTFKEMVGSWVQFYKSKSAWPSTWTAVDTKQYYHEYALDPTIDDQLRRPCRDTRYKFDKTARSVWNDAANDAGSDAHKLVEFLKGCGLEEPDVLSDREFSELVELYKDEDTARRCDALLSQATKDPTLIPKALQALWIGTFPWPDAPRAVETYFPVTHDEIDKWLRQKARILRPNVRRRLCEDIDPVVDVLHWATQRHGALVIKDFEERLDNEASLMWNDVRSGRIRNSLRRRWQHPEAIAASELTDEAA